MLGSSIDHFCVDDDGVVVLLSVALALLVLERINSFVGFEALLLQINDQSWRGCFQFLVLLEEAVVGLSVSRPTLGT